MHAAAQSQQLWLSCSGTNSPPSALYLCVPVPGRIKWLLHVWSMPCSNCQRAGKFQTFLLFCHTLLISSKFSLLSPEKLFHIKYINKISGRSRFFQALEQENYEFSHQQMSRLDWSDIKHDNFQYSCVYLRWSCTKWTPEDTFCFVFCGFSSAI